MDHVLLNASIQKAEDTWLTKPIQYIVDYIFDILKIFCKGEDESLLLEPVFQDMIASNAAADATIKKYLKRLAYNITEDDGLNSLMDECPDFRDHYLDCLGIMIGNEMALSQANYLVFYRSVRENIILYELNTLMLSIFSENYHATANNLVCTPCLLEECYPDSIDQHLNLMKTKAIMADDDGGVDRYLLSVNNCLSISNSDSGSFYRHCHLHCREASPLSFYKGYMGIFTWQYIIKDFLVKFLEQSEESCDHIVKLMTEKYKSQFLDEYGDDGGHLIQICIPREYADAFVYTSFAYGMPASLYVLPKTKVMAQSAFDEPPPDALGKLSLQEVMNSKHMGKVQSRILAHPNLYLEHGAFAEVVSGSRGFDRKRLQDDLRQILAPAISEALARGKRLTYSKFAFC